MALRGSEEWRRAVGEGRRRASGVRRALAVFSSTGEVMPAIREAATEAFAEAEGLVAALGGVDRLSEQRAALIGNLARSGTVIRVLWSRILRDELDLDAVSKLTSLLNSHRAGLLALGLDRVASDAVDLETYLAREYGSPAPAAPAAAAPAALEPEVLES